MSRTPQTAKYGIALLQGMPGTGMSGGRCYVVKDSQETYVICPETGKWAAVPSAMVTFVACPSGAAIQWMVV